MNDQTRNLNPTPEAIIAMCIWGAEYGAQNGGSMDFYDKLNLARKRQCEDIVRKIKEAIERHDN